MENRILRGCNAEVKPDMEVAGQVYSVNGDAIVRAAATACPFKENTIPENLVDLGT